MLVDLLEQRNRHKFPSLRLVDNMMIGSPQKKVLCEYLFKLTSEHFHVYPEPKRVGATHKSNTSQNIEYEARSKIGDG